MTVPIAYQWTFDLSDLPPGTPVFTLSVGVYQWLPKASGKGLKKSKTIRICGYAAEREKVYQKASELCHRFNEAGARADSPPQWLQKQYSVPKPPGLIIERRSNDLTASQVRSIRLQVMREELLPLGFIRGKGGVFVRRIGEQIHLIHFNSYGGQFTASVAFHFTFLPPLSHRHSLQLFEFGLLDCALQERGALALPQKGTHNFHYRADREELRQTLRRCAAEGLLVLDAYSERWNDPKEFYSWTQSDEERYWFLCDEDLVAGCLALRLGLIEEAKRRLGKWNAETPILADKTLFAQLMQDLWRLQGGQTDSKVLLNWMTD